MKTRIMSH